MLNYHFVTILMLVLCTCSCSLIIPKPTGWMLSNLSNKPRSPRIALQMYSAILCHLHFDLPEVLAIHRPQTMMKANTIDIDSIASTNPSLTDLSLQMQLSVQSSHDYHQWPML
mmetsp:Transcript_45196/g.109378  ORF Transcript_45196/g.109378 Transcript_45196/m.109378 type:complete len:113 (-) Transcript_45196:97-435(-)